MERPRRQDPTARLRDVAQACPGVEALVLYGSRARGDASPLSDWDLGYLANSDLDATGLLASIVVALGDDRVDLVDLERAGGQLRYRAACDARTLFERMPDRVERFRLEAIAYWLDMAPVIRAEYEAYLAKLAR